jgi:hypothetical protein
VIAEGEGSFNQDLPESSIDETSQDDIGSNDELYAEVSDTAKESDDSKPTTIEAANHDMSIGSGLLAERCGPR